jgi:hypothetical protein
MKVGEYPKYPWVKSVTKLPTRERRFQPIQEGKRWVIQLFLAFEQKRACESTDIPTDARGIYRYIREGGEVACIGRGEIRKRLKSPDRNDWDFDVIEYSVVDDPDIQVKWESYWLDRYKEEHKGELPFYNRLSGKSEK